jgi:hypothetical protein
MGFTFVEIMVASVIAFVLFQAVYQLFFSTLNSNKVHDEYTSKLMACRVVLMQVQRLTVDARAILHPIPSMTVGTTSSNTLVFRDSIGLVKTLSFSKETGELKMHTLDLQTGTMVPGSLDPDLGGTLQPNPRRSILGKGLKEVVFTVDSMSMDTLQYRIMIDDFHLVGGVRLLNG